MQLFMRHQKFIGKLHYRGDTILIYHVHGPHKDSLDFWVVGIQYVYSRLSFATAAIDRMFGEGETT
jgi:hypothetical protein